LTCLSLKYSPMVGIPSSGATRSSTQECLLTCVGATPNLLGLLAVVVADLFLAMDNLFDSVEDDNRRWDSSFSRL
ncbi:hypothetical protein PENTCL1PPCAC_27255, partial [Pristionchus entomophagus]